MESKLINCLIKGRKEFGIDEYLFHYDTKTGYVIANLDGYAIVPLEHYNDLHERYNDLENRYKNLENKLMKISCIIKNNN
jgi:hypothetical protein